MSESDNFLGPASRATRGAEKIEESQSTNRQDDQRWDVYLDY